MEKTKNASSNSVRKSQTGASQSGKDDIFAKQKVRSKEEQQIFSTMVQETAQNGYIHSTDKGLQLGLHSSSDDDSDGSDSEGNSLMSPRERRKIKKQKKKQEALLKGKGKKANRDELEMSSIYSKDPNKLDMIKNLNSTKLIAISSQFDLYPNEEVDLEQFVKIMQAVMHDTKLKNREDFIQQLVDLFYRANKANSTVIKFEDLTSYLIEHEIEQYTESATSVDMQYTESDIVDKTTHNNFIEKIYYFPEIDKVILYEQNNKVMRIYQASTMKLEDDVACTGQILAIEFVKENAIAVSLSDRTITFFDTANSNQSSSVVAPGDQKGTQSKRKRKTYKILHQLHVPSTQKCMAYVKRKNKNILFSGGPDGAIFAWNLDKLFSSDFGENLNSFNSQKKMKEETNRDKEKREYINYIAEKTPWFTGFMIMCIIDLPNINQLASGGYDKEIKLWDLRSNQIENQFVEGDLPQDFTSTAKGKGVPKQKAKKKNDAIKMYFNKPDLPDELFEEYTKTPSKALEGHKQAIREIAYSDQHKIIISCAFDFQVLVWNPYLNENIQKLDGHEHPLVGVNALPALNCFITADHKGMVKVWNILDYSCIQTFYVPNVNQVTCIKAVPKHRRLICGSRNFKVFSYTKPFLPEYSDDNPITCAKFSHKRMEIYVAGAESIKVWNARTGKPVRVLKNVFNNDITCMEFDSEHRKLIVGSHQGQVKVFDNLSGIMTHEIEGHDPQEGEISYIGYGGEDHTIITCGWDKVIKIHKDERLEHKEPKDSVMRGKANCHWKDIICGDYSHNLQLIATGGRDNSVRIWSYERVILQSEINAHKSEVQIVRFLKPFPLLLTTDIYGVLYIWLTKPHPDAGKCVLHWRNNFTLQKYCPITAIDSHYDAKTGEFFLLVGDEMGQVRIQDIKAILKQIPTLKEEDLTKNTKRNPHRIFQIKPVETGLFNAQRHMDGSDDDDDIEKSSDINPIVDESEIYQVSQFEAHSDVIRSIQYVAVTDDPVIMTASLDRMVHIWNFRGESMGTLKQGYKMKEDYLWKFPVKNYNQGKEERQTKMEEMLKEVRKIRNDEMSNKKKELIKKITEQEQAGKVTFGDNYLQGMNNTAVGAMPAQGLGSPSGGANYYSTGYGQSQASTMFEDNSVRGQMRTKASRVIERARQYMDVESRKQQRRQTGKKMLTTAGQNVLNGGKGNGDGMDQMTEMKSATVVGNNRKIGPFAFGIDNDFNTEILTSEMVYADLIELDDILGKSHESGPGAGAGSHAYAKLRRRKR